MQIEQDETTASAPHQVGAQAEHPDEALQAEHPDVGNAGESKPMPVVRELSSKDKSVADTQRSAQPSTVFPDRDETNQDGSVAEALHNSWIDMKSEAMLQVRQIVNESATELLQAQSFFVGAMRTCGSQMYGLGSQMHGLSDDVEGARLGMNRLTQHLNKQEESGVDDMRGGHLSSMGTLETLLQTEELRGQDEPSAGSSGDEQLENNELATSALVPTDVSAIQGIPVAEAVRGDNGITDSERADAADASREQINSDRAEQPEMAGPASLEAVPDHPVEANRMSYMLTNDVRATQEESASQDGSVEVPEDGPLTDDDDLGLQCYDPPLAAEPHRLDAPAEPPETNEFASSEPAPSSEQDVPAREVVQAEHPQRRVTASDHEQSRCVAMCLLNEVSTLNPQYYSATLD